MTIVAASSVGFSAAVNAKASASAIARSSRAAGRGASSQLHDARPPADYPVVTSLPRTALVTLAAALVVAAPADAATKHHRHKPKRPAAAAVASKPAPAPAPSPAAAPAPAVNSVISIGGYVFHGLTYEQAVA